MIIGQQGKARSVPPWVKYKQGAMEAQKRIRNGLGALRLRIISSCLRPIPQHEMWWSLCQDIWIVHHILSSSSLLFIAMKYLPMTILGISQIHSLPFFFFFFFLGQFPWQMEVLQARGPTGAIAASIRRSHSNTVSELHLQPTHSSRQHWILNPLRKARDQTCTLRNTTSGS